MRLGSALASWVHLVAAMGLASPPAECAAITEARRERDILTAPASGGSRGGCGNAPGVIPHEHNRVKIAQILHSGAFLALARRIHAASRGSHQALPGAQGESPEGVTIDPLVLLGLCLRSQITPLVQFIFPGSLDISMHEICPDCAAHAANTAPHVHSVISKIQRAIGDSEQKRAFLKTLRLPSGSGVSATLLVSGATFRLGVAG